MSLPCPIRAAAQATPAAPALRFSGRTWSYGELDGEVGRWTAALARRGVGAGDRVALLALNHPSLVRAFFALGRLGALAAPLNARLTPAELTPLVDTLEPRLLLAQEALAPRLPHALLLEALEAEASAPGAPSAPAAHLTPAAPRVLLFTSGTTGVPKGALLSEANLRASAAASHAHLGVAGAPRWLGTLPLFHVGGLAMLTRCAYAGGLLLLHERFDAPAASRALDEDAVSHASFVPTALERLLEAREGRPVPPTFLAALIGGGPVPAPLLAHARALRLPALQTYGLTEATSQVCTERPAEADGTTAGPPLPGLAVRIVGESGEPLPGGAEGDIEVRGPTVMAAFFRAPEATREALRPDGWLRTRDIGALDARGRLRVCARRVDLILSGGENVYPAEVEAVLTAHPRVAEAGVVGCDDARWGQVPVAVVVARGAGGLPADLEAWCRARLAGFKVPRRFVPAAALPRNALGKVDRAALRKLASP